MLFLNPYLAPHNNADKYCHKIKLKILTRVAFTFVYDEDHAAMPEKQKGLVLDQATAGQVSLSFHEERHLLRKELILLVPSTCA